MTQYVCPDCDRVVWHDCHPASYYRREPPLTRTAQLPALLAVELPDAEYPTLEESFHDVFADVAGGYRPPTPEQAQTETAITPRPKRRKQEEGPMTATPQPPHPSTKTGPARDRPHVTQSDSPEENETPT